MGLNLGATSDSLYGCQWDSTHCILPPKEMGSPPRLLSKRKKRSRFFFVCRKPGRRRRLPGAVICGAGAWRQRAFVGVESRSINCCSVSNLGLNLGAKTDKHVVSALGAMIAPLWAAIADCKAIAKTIAGGTFLIPIIRVALALQWVDSFCRKEGGTLERSFGAHTHVASARGSMELDASPWGLGWD